MNESDTGEQVDKLVATPAAAETLGISARTLQRYVAAGVVEPEVTLPSGQYRWKVAELAEQIALVSRRRRRR